MCEFMAFLCCGALGPIPISHAFQTFSIPDAEAFAVSLLQQATIHAPDLVKLFDLLPQAPPRRDSVGAPGSSFTSGAFAHGKGIMGCRSICRTHPFSAEAFCKYVSQVEPKHCFSSLTVLNNVRSAPHRDASNPPHSMNLILPLTEFQHGQVWVEDVAGTVFREVDSQLVPGRLLPVADGPQYLPRILRCTLPSHGLGGLLCWRVASSLTSRSH